tara:strand:- start:73165 stop:74070 length:906 start_codon:yes stop_codon:yes gene_type:complete
MAYHSTPAAPKLHKMKPLNLSYQIFDRNITGLDWNTSADIKSLALHGWLDNAASFSVLSPFLKNINLLAIDLAGQGQSDFRSIDSSYGFLGELRDLYELSMQPSTQLTNGRINLVGHSRGAIVCTIFAAVFPERVNKLVLIDSIEPFPHALSDMPNALAEAVKSNYSLAGRTGTYYATKEKALQARMDGLVPVSKHSAELLAERSLLESEKGWTWRADQRLKAAYAYRINNEMREDFYSRITAPTLVIEPKNGMLKLDTRFKQAGSTISDLTKFEVPGGHHCHMEDCPKLVAELIEGWLSA